MALQKTTEKKLSELFNYLTEQGENDKARLITEILRSECKVKRGTHFSMYDFTGKKTLRQYECVYYDNGCQIATDGRQILVLKQDYDKELEGKAIDKYGVELDTKFPKYKAVLPKSLDGYEKHEIDPERFYSWIDERRAAFKLQNDGKSIKYDGGWFVRIGHCLFAAELFNLIIKAAKELGSMTIHTIASDQGAVIQTEKGIYLAMPWNETDSPDVLVM